VLRHRAGAFRELLRVRPSTVDLVRRGTAELIGTAALLAGVVGSGIAAPRLSPGDVGVQLMENAVATGAVLVAVILALGRVSGAHLNPVVTLVDRLLGGVSSREAIVYVVAQVVGACLGAVVANAMFDLAAVTVSTHVRSGGGIWLSEVVATFGLLLVILGVVRARDRAFAPFAVGAYVAAAYWFTSSTGFANPAATVARMLSDTFAGIAPTSVLAFLSAQLLGGLLAFVVARALFVELPADAVVVPHESELS
jgi:arsenate reductase